MHELFYDDERVKTSSDQLEVELLTFRPTF